MKEDQDLDNVIKLAKTALLRDGDRVSLDAEPLVRMLHALGIHVESFYETGDDDPWVTFHLRGLSDFGRVVELGAGWVDSDPASLYSRVVDPNTADPAPISWTVCYTALTRLSYSSGAM